MSTKIHYGYRVSVDDPFEALALLKAAVEPVYRTTYLTLLATIARGVSEGESEFDFEPVERAGVPIMSAWRHLSSAHRKIKATGRRNPGVDLELDVCFLRDATDGGLYALLYTERESYRDALPPCFEWWPYWDNTDGPDEISEEDWDARGDTWDRLVGWDAPARRGLSWSLIGDRLIADIPAVDDPEGIARFLPAVFDVASLYADEDRRG